MEIEPIESFRGKIEEKDIILQGLILGIRRELPDVCIIVNGGTVGTHKPTHLKKIYLEVREENIEWRIVESSTIPYPRLTLLLYGAATSKKEVIIEASPEKIREYLRGLGYTT